MPQNCISNKSKNVHSAILVYVLNSDSTMNHYNVIKAINELDRVSILELNDHGHNHLKNILHLCFDFPEHLIDSNKVADLINVLLKKAKSLKIFQRFICRMDAQGLNTFQQVFSTSDEPTIIVYLKNVGSLSDPKFKDTFVRLMEASSAFGITGLDKMLFAKNSVNLKIFFSFLNYLINKKVLDSTVLKLLILKENVLGLNFLHQVLLSDNPNHLSIFFTELELILKKGWITQQEYRELILKLNNEKFTPFYIAMVSSNSKIFEIYHQQLLRSSKEGSINNSDYFQSIKDTLALTIEDKNPQIFALFFEKINFITQVQNKSLLMGQATNGNSILQLALKEENLEIVKLILHATIASGCPSMLSNFLEVLDREPFLMDEKIANDLFFSPLGELTALHLAAYSEVLGIFESILEKIQKMPGYKKALIDKTPGYIPIAHAGNTNAFIINRILETQREKIKEKTPQNSPYSSFYPPRLFGNPGIFQRNTHPHREYGKPYKRYHQ